MEKITGNEPAFGYGFCTADGQSHSEEKGLSKREYFAAIAMQGFCVNIKTLDSETALEFVPKMAVAYADALIEQLNKTTLTH